MSKIILTTISWFFTTLEIILLARLFLSWFPHVGFLFPIRKVLFELTEPILEPIRKLVAKSIFQGNGNIFDISPLIAFIVLNALKAMF